MSTAVLTVDRASLVLPAGDPGAQFGVALTDVLVTLQSSGSVDIISRVSMLPTYRWFTIGYICFGLSMGLMMAARYIGFQRDLRSTNETVDNATEYVRLFLVQARVTELEGKPDSQPTTLAVLAFIFLVPTLIWIGRVGYWAVVEVPGGLEAKFWLFWAGLLMMVPFCVLGMCFAIPLCVGVAVYVETIARGVRVLIG